VLVCVHNNGIADISDMKSIRKFAATYIQDKHVIN